MRPSLEGEFWGRCMERKSWIFDTEILEVATLLVMTSVTRLW